MAKVILHGELSEKYGKEFNCKVPTGRKCLQLLLCQLPGFYEDLVNGFFKFTV